MFCRPSDVVVDVVAYIFTTLCFGFTAIYVWSFFFVLSPARARILSAPPPPSNATLSIANYPHNLLAEEEISQSSVTSVPAQQPSASSAPAVAAYTAPSYNPRTPRVRYRPSAAAGSSSARTPASAGGGAAHGSASSTRPPTPSYTPKGHPGTSRPSTRQAQCDV